MAFHRFAAPSAQAPRPRRATTAITTGAGDGDHRLARQRPPAPGEGRESPAPVGAGSAPRHTESAHNATPHVNARENWPATVESQGLYYHTADGVPYWDESVYYQLQPAEVDELEAATYALNEMCLKAVEYVLQEDRFAQFQIPAEHQPYIRKSWDRDEHTIYGRFDFAYDSQSPPKMLEYNADTPRRCLKRPSSSGSGSATCFLRPRNSIPSTSGFWRRGSRCARKRRTECTSLRSPMRWKIT